ncbi:helix-turn-helix transcriptional regulator [Rhizobium sp. SG2393]|uniref:helix-turn-helix transcriptional regulator n=1 Tax=Rhizobium sp. SG2393 TaxID=3276279 RepID=UPI00366E328E
MINDMLPPLPGGNSNAAGDSKGAIQTDYEILRLLRQVTGEAGFSHFMVARPPSTDVQRFQDRLVLSNWPTELVRQYDQANAFVASQVLARVRQTRLPVYGDAALLLPAERSQDCGLHGVLRGLKIETVFAVMMPSADDQGFIITLAGSRAYPEPEEVPGIYFSLLQIMDRYERAIASRAVSSEKLSMREIECLRWAAAGKSSDEIAIILGISAYTVSSYFKTAMRKLGAVNRMQAIARAIRLKLL